MILLAAFLLLVAVGLLAAGLADGSAALQWSSFSASVLAAVVLVVGEVRRRRATRAGGEAPAGTAAATAEPAPPRAEEPPAAEAPAPAAPPPAAHTAPAAPGAHASVPAGPAGEPPVEEVEVIDLLLVLDLTDEVFVIDEHPRYHLAGCPHLAGRDTFPMPMVEARTDGFTPCGTCAPDRHLAQRERSRRAGA